MMATRGEVIQLQGADYILCQPLATSAYGVVWRALEKCATGKAVALKLVNQQKMQQAQSDLQHHWIHSAEQEIAFLRQLSPWDQRHIARLLDHGQHQSLPAFALELLPENLHRYMQSTQSKKASAAQALRWLAQINQALAKVHQFGYCYLDLKPSNILLGQDGIKLIDFGTSLNATGAANMQDFRGTPRWQAPEQFFPASTDAAGWRYSLDYRSDYFALGAMLYFLICGVPLRFCSLCGQAYRQHGVWGAQQIQGEQRACTLYADEEQLFLENFSLASAAEDTQDKPDTGTYTGSLSVSGNKHASESHQAQAALAFLRKLLAYHAEQRPQNAMEISSALAQINACAVVAQTEVARPQAQPSLQTVQQATTANTNLGAPHSKMNSTPNSTVRSQTSSTTPPKPFPAKQANFGKPRVFSQRLYHCWQAYILPAFAELLLAVCTFIACLGLLAIWSVPASAAIDFLSANPAPSSFFKGTDHA